MTQPAARLAASDTRGGANKRTERVSAVGTRNVGAKLHPPDKRRGWAVVLTLPEARVELSPGEAVGLLRQLTDAVREWTRQTAAAGVVLALVAAGRDAAEADGALTVALMDGFAPGRRGKRPPRPPVTARGA